MPRATGQVRLGQAGGGAWQNTWPQHCSCPKPTSGSLPEARQLCTGQVCHLGSAEGVSANSLAARSQSSWRSRHQIRPPPSGPDNGGSGQCLPTTGTALPSPSWARMKVTPTRRPTRLEPGGSSQGKTTYNHGSTAHVGGGHSASPTLISWAPRPLKPGGRPASAATRTAAGLRHPRPPPAEPRVAPGHSSTPTGSCHVRSGKIQVQIPSQPLTGCLAQGSGCYLLERVPHL